MAELDVQRQPPEIAELVAALRPIVQSGLPVPPSMSDSRLLGLRGVVARAVDPSDRLNRVKALDGLLKKALASYPDDALGEPARILFGLAPGSRGTKLTHRRETAAAAASYEMDHFRKRIEPRIVEQVAWLLHQDAQNYIPRERETPGLGTAPPPLEASGDTPTITAGDLLMKEASEHQEALSRLWAHVYNLRAHVLRVERLKVWPEDETEPEQHESLQRAIARRNKEVRTVRILVERYIQTYGDIIEHGEGEFSARALLRLAGWQ